MYLIVSFLGYSIRTRNESQSKEVINGQRWNLLLPMITLQICIGMESSGQVQIGADIDREALTMTISACAVAKTNSKMISINKNAPVASNRTITIHAESEKVWKILTNINDCATWQTDIGKPVLNDELKPQTTFDMDYYCHKHLPMVNELLGDLLKGATVEKGLGGATPGSPATYAGMGNMYFHSMADFKAAFGPNTKKLWVTYQTSPMQNLLFRSVKL